MASLHRGIARWGVFCFWLFNLTKFKLCSHSATFSMSLLSRPGGRERHQFLIPGNECRPQQCMFDQKHFPSFSVKLPLVGC